MSFMIHCERQDEVDHYWNRLADGGEEGQCGWLKDQYGVSWQVVPSVMPELLGDPDPETSQRVMGAMLKMGKIDIAALEDAAAARVERGTRRRAGRCASAACAQPIPRRVRGVEWAWRVAGGAFGGGLAGSGVPGGGGTSAPKTCFLGLAGEQRFEFFFFDRFALDEDLRSSRGSRGGWSGCPWRAGGRPPRCGGSRHRSPGRSHRCNPAPAENSRPRNGWP